ncbi:nucleoside deaminase [Roseicella frigidaeris]|uniref:Nucleoside deaminase n=1 Tax=Roseicella frigidaeris TaxID=2230885 RepID=A0A327MC48_9PROT|nr:nucleoside deaminase [Roseicella frigidaeris]RAI59754.1 nucleoside deaminase [Roseicella frigidaeris]
MPSDPTPPASEQDIAFMRRAIELAKQGERARGASPIGCVIVMDGRIVAEAHNEVDIRHDPTAHAEVMAMRRAGEALGVSQFPDAVLYSTLQPCGMCSMASIWAKIGRIVYGAERDDVHQMYFEGRHLDTMDFITDAFRDDLSVKGGVLRRECAGLYHQPGEDVPLEEQANI